VIEHLPSKHEAEFKLKSRQKKKSPAINESNRFISPHPQQN
jgi:hypothetical protein